jgi:hypothetical protein
MKDNIKNYFKATVCVDLFQMTQIRFVGGHLCIEQQFSIKGG